MGKKNVTRKQAQTMYERAITFLRNTGEGDKADEFEGMGLDGYIEHKKLVLTSEPQSKKSTGGNGRVNGSSSLSPTKRSAKPMAKTSVVAELESELDETAEDLEIAEEDAETADTTIARVWDELCDVDETTSPEDMLEAVDAACELIAAYDVDRFVIDGPEDGDTEQ